MIDQFKIKVLIQAAGLGMVTLTEFCHAMWDFLTTVSDDEMNID